MRRLISRSRDGRESDRGATALEYAGALLIGGVIIGLLVLLMPNPVGRSVKIALCKIFEAGANGGRCEPAPFDYRPATGACLIKSSSGKVGANVTVFSIKLGQNVQLVRTETADGKVRITVVPDDYKLGAEAEIGAKVYGGKDSYGLKLGASVEGSLNFKYGDTWVFPDGDAANKFIDDMKWDLARREAEHVSPGLWVFDKVTGWKPRSRDPDVRQWEVSAEGVLKGSAGFGNVTESTNSSGQTERSIKDIGTGIEIQGKVGDGVIITKDNSQPDKPGYPLTSTTFQVQGSYSYGGKVVGYGPGGERSYLGQTKITRDKSGKLVSITWVTTQQTNDSEGLKNPGSKNASVKGTDKQVTTTTTTVNFDDSNRQLGEQWIHDNAFLMPFQTVRNAVDADAGFATRDPGPNASPFDQLLYRRGVVSRNTYAGDVDEFRIGAEVGAEVKFGIDVGYESENLNLVDSQYLGPPQDGQRSFQDWPECKAK
ncbi:MAG: hypothetical protein J2P17_07320 [Mycobacterium sp.]|nr:hypothetical protein [Mycobacterium sp.]